MARRTLRPMRPKPLMPILAIRMFVSCDFDLRLLIKFHQQGKGWESKMVKRAKQFRTAMLLAGLMWVPWAQTGSAARIDSARMKYILVLGDSLSDGIGLKRS